MGIAKCRRPTCQSRCHDAATNGELKRWILVKAFEAALANGASLSEGTVSAIPLPGSDHHLSNHDDHDHDDHDDTTITTPHQVGQPNLSECCGLFINIDFAAVAERYKGKITGSGVRNQLYYEGMKHSGLTGKGNNQRAPEYYIATAEAAFPYGKSFTSKEMPRSHGIAYDAEESPTSEEMESLIAIMTNESSA